MLRYDILYSYFFTIFLLYSWYIVRKKHIFIHTLLYQFLAIQKLLNIYCFDLNDRARQFFIFMVLLQTRQLHVILLSSMIVIYNYSFIARSNVILYLFHIIIDKFVLPQQSSNLIVLTHIYIVPSCKYLFGCNCMQ